MLKGKTRAPIVQPAGAKQSTSAASNKGKAVVTVAAQKQQHPIEPQLPSPKLQQGAAMFQGMLNGKTMAPVVQPAAVSPLFVADQGDVGPAHASGAKQSASALVRSPRTADAADPVGARVRVLLDQNLYAATILQRNDQNI